MMALGADAGRYLVVNWIETHYKRRCLGSFPYTTRLGTMPFSKDGLIIARNVSEKMDNILKNYEVLVCVHLLTDTMIRR